jgi:hypothetical protein
MYTHRAGSSERLLWKIAQCVIWFCFVVLAIWYIFFRNVARSYAPALECQQDTVECFQQQASWYASVYHIDEKQYFRTIQKESGFQENPKGWNDGGLAYGIAQYHYPTFIEHSRLCFPSSTLSYRDAGDQLATMACAFSRGWQGEWSAWKWYYYRD